MKIIMLPCAGGNSLMFKKISAVLEKSIEVHCLDYTGHVKLIQSPLLKTIEEIKGNHFFINESTEETIDILEKRVLKKPGENNNEAGDKTAAAGAANGEIHWGKRSNINL